MRRLAERAFSACFDAEYAERVGAIGTRPMCVATLAALLAEVEGDDAPVTRM
jgi:hypothetical protein